MTDIASSTRLPEREGSEDVAVHPPISPGFLAAAGIATFLGTLFYHRGREGAAMMHSLSRSVRNTALVVGVGAAIDWLWADREIKHLQDELKQEDVRAIPAASK